VKNGSNFVMGDFNLPYINWDSLYCPDELIHKIVFDFAINHGFAQLVNYSTREQNVLDLVFTDNDCLITDVKPCLPLGHSDHSSVELTLTMSSIKNGKPTVTNDAPYHYHYLWHRGDYKMACYLSGVDWYTLIGQHPSVESMWNSLVIVLWFAVGLYVPLRRNACDAAQHIKKPTKSRKLRKCAIKKLKIWNKIRKYPHNSKLRSDYRECVHS